MKRKDVPEKYDRLHRRPCRNSRLQQRSLAVWRPAPCSRSSFCRPSTVSSVVKMSEAPEAPAVEVARVLEVAGSSQGATGFGMAPEPPSMFFSIGRAMSRMAP